MTRDRMRALKYSNDDVEAVTQLVYLHLRFHTYRMGWDGQRGPPLRAGRGSLARRVDRAHACDCTTRNKRKADQLARRMDELEARIAVLREHEELVAIRPDLDGRRVMELLGVPPGPLVGEALAYLLEVRLDEGPLGDDEAARRLEAWWAERRTRRRRGQLIPKGQMPSLWPAAA